MPRDIMSSEPRHWMVFGQLVMAVQCCAEAPPQPCLVSDDIMSLGIKSSAFLRALVLQHVHGCGAISPGGME